MADSEGKNYYWESLNQNTTGENVGVVLDSLCDIVEENEIEENQDVVKWIPGEEGQKGHFELGEGGSKIPPINANTNQILIGTGPQDYWVQGNENNFYAMYTGDDMSEEHRPLESSIATDSSLFPIAFGTLEAGEQGAVRPRLKNGYRAQNNALADISGNARFYMGENSRIAVHDNAWIDVTGNDTQVKFNSGSKFFVDSLYGKNNMYMHGGFVVINDGKEPSHAKAGISYYVLKSEYPDEPAADLQFFDENGTIYWKSKKFSIGYPYKEEEEAIIDSPTFKSSDLTDIGYTYTLSDVYEQDIYVEGKWNTGWRLDANFEKYDNEHPDIHIDGLKPYNYNEGYNWPSESEDVPRINITGAPRIQIGDYSLIWVQSGARLDLSKQSQLVAAESFTSLLSSHLIMQGCNDATLYPYIMLNNCDYGRPKGNQISLGFTTENPKSTSIPKCPIVEDMLATPQEDHCPITISDSTIGPYQNLRCQKLQLNGPGYMVNWLNEKINDVYKTDYLPLIHYGDRVYIHASVAKGSAYIINPQIDQGSNYIYAPSIQGGCTFDVAPVLNQGTKFAAKFGGSAAAQTSIQYTPNGGIHSFFSNPGVGCETYFQDMRESGTTLALNIQSIAGSNMLFTIHGGMGYGGIYNGSSIGYQSRPGTIQKIIEGLDTFELETGKIHKEMRDDSCFIMRGENRSSYNSPTISYLSDASQYSNTNRFAKEKCHLNKYWDRPINNEGLTSPTFQMYEHSNLILRGFWKYPEKTVTIETDIYSGLTEDTPISLTELKSHTTEWEKFLAAFEEGEQEFIGLVPESSIIASPTKITVQRACYQFIGDTSYVKKYHPNAGLDTFGKRSSIIEITDNSELRLWDGICIYARYNPQTNEPTIEFVNRYGTNGTDMDETNVATGDNKEPLDRVEFTFDELKYLKRFIGTLPSRIANNDSEATEPNTLYFIPGE